MAEYAGIKSLRGLLTGLNEAFLIDSIKRDEVVREDPKCSEIIKPYLRGQDIDCWYSSSHDLYMIVMRSSGNCDWPETNMVDEAEGEKIFVSIYPALYRHFKSFEDLGKNMKTGKPRGLRYRGDQGRYWWELPACDYYDAFEAPKLLYVDIT